MAVWRITCANTKVKINDADHEPPHCHAKVGGKNLRISTETLKVLNPPPAYLPPALRKCLREHQVAMLQAWERVIILSVEGRE